MGMDTGHSLGTHVLPGPMTYIRHLFRRCILHTMRQGTHLSHSGALSSTSLLMTNTKLFTKTGENLSYHPTCTSTMSTKRIPRPNERALAMSTSARNSKRKDARERGTTSKKRKTTSQGLPGMRLTHPASKETPTTDGTDEEQDIVARLDNESLDVEHDGWSRPATSILIESDMENAELSNVELGMILYEELILLLTYKQSV